MYPEVVDLNVGGVFYTASLSTLTKIPGAYLTDLFTSKSRTPVKDSHGRFFIDRDGVLFRYILEFLRNGEVLLPENFQEVERLRYEAHFYRLGNSLNIPSPAPQMDETNGGYMPTKHADMIGSGGGGGGGGSLGSLVSVGAPPPPHAATVTATTMPYRSGGDAVRGVITVGYRGTFAFGREGTAEVKFRKLTRILVCGRVSLCREVFGETLNESRDPDRGSDDRYTSRFFLKHSYLEQAFDMLADRGFRLVGCCGTGTSSAGNGSLETGTPASQKSPATVDSEESRWNHYNEFVWQRG